jgi:signal transduction histidine kinase
MEEGSAPGSNVMWGLLGRHRDQLSELVSEQAALRRIATLVARAAPPTEVFRAVAEEVGHVFPADATFIGRYDGDAVTVVGCWSRPGSSIRLGARIRIDGRNLTALVVRTGRPARQGSFADATGDDAEHLCQEGFRSGLGVPVTVAGRLWGLMVVLSRAETPLPCTEQRLADFTELLGTAIANAEVVTELWASRARVSAGADEARRRLQRDLHDGAQQQLVSLALRLRAVQAAVPPGLDKLAAELGQVAAGLTAALDELRQLASGIHPAILAQHGLGPALRALVHRSTVPVALTVDVADRPPEPVEVAAYYVVSEALTNAAKHASASNIEVDAQTGNGALRISVRDNGVGGADMTSGSGLLGLKDRVQSLGGAIALDSEPGAGTHLSVELPFETTTIGRWL